MRFFKRAILKTQPKRTMMPMRILAALKTREVTLKDGRILELD